MCAMTYAFLEGIYRNFPYVPFEVLLFGVGGVTVFDAAGGISVTLRVEMSKV